MSTVCTSGMAAVVHGDFSHRTVGDSPQEGCAITNEPAMMTMAGSLCCFLRDMQHDPHKVHELPKFEYILSTRLIIQ